MSWADIFAWDKSRSHSPQVSNLTFGNAKLTAQTTRFAQSRLSVSLRLYFITSCKRRWIRQEAEAVS